MGWNDVGANAPKGGDSLPILKIEAGKPVRIRLIDGGGKYSEPAKRFQHFSDDNNIKSPIACIGSRSGCIFHSGPLNWRVNASFCMNVIVYTMKGSVIEDRKILAFPAGNSVYGGIKDHADLLGVDPMKVDWIITRTGTGKNDTKYTVVMAPGAPLDGETLNLDEYPKQAQFGDAAAPQLVDYDMFDGYRKRTPAEQEAWYNTMLGVSDSAPALGSGAREALPPARPEAIDAEYTETTSTTPPPRPKIGLGGPPPRPTAVAKPDPKSMKDPWGERTMGELTSEDLQYIVATDGFSAEHKAAAQEILGVATSNGGTANIDSLRSELTQYLKTLPSIEKFQDARKFMSLGGAQSIQRMSAEGLHKLLNLARQGDAAVAQAIAAANG